MAHSNGAPQHWQESLGPKGLSASLDRGSLDNMTDNSTIESARAWYVVAGAFLILTFGFGSLYAFGTFFTPLQDAFGASRASVSAAFSLAVLTLFAIGPLTGTLADRLGPRALVAGGTALVGCGLIIASFAQALWQVQAAFTVCIGIGVGMAYVPAAGAVQKWFDRRRGLASGIAIAGIGVGTLVVPPIGAALIAELEWRPAFFIIGLVVAVGGGAAGLMVTSPANRRRKEAAGKREGGGIGLTAAVRSRPFLLMFAGFLLASLGMYTPIAHLVPYAEDRGISPQSAAILLSLLGIGSALGRFAIGAAADHIGRWRGLGLSFGGIGLSSLVWLVSDGLAGLGAFAVLLGLSWGGAVALAPSVMADYFGTRAVSGIIGVLYAGVGVGALVGPVIAGRAFDLWESYSVAIAYSTVAPVIGAAFVLVAESPGDWRRRYNTAGASVAKEARVSGADN